MFPDQASLCPCDLRKHLLEKSLKALMPDKERQAPFWELVPNVGQHLLKRHSLKKPQMEHYQVVKVLPPAGDN